MNETDKTFLISRREVNYKGVKCDASTTVTLYTDIRRFSFKIEFHEKSTLSMMGSLNPNISSSLTEEIYNAMEKRLLYDEDLRVFMIFRDWVKGLNVAESTANEMIRICSV